MLQDSQQHPQLEGLMTFLAVARLGRYTAAGTALGINHSTVSRRVAALEKAMGGRVLVRSPSGWEVTELGRAALAAAEEVEQALMSLTGRGGGGALSGVVRIAAPDAFSVHFAAPALTALQAAHPGLDVELISATQRVRQTRSGVDLEIVVGKPFVHRAVAAPVLDYSLGLYASRAYLAEHGTPRSLAGLEGHRLVYYIESALHIDDLDRATEGLPRMRRGMGSTSVFAHAAATAAGAGVGILPVFLAEAEAGLVRILAEEYDYGVSYWAVAREEALRSPAVAACFGALRR